MSTFAVARRLFTSRIRASALILVAASGLALSGCQNMDPTQRGTAQGAGIGAAGGAVLGGLLGGRSGAITGGLLGAAGGAVAGNVWSTRQQEREQQMRAATQGTQIQVVRTQDNRLRIDVPSDVSFDTGSAAIKPSLLRVLDQFAGGLRSDPDARVMIIGHTDSTGGDAVNYPLSVARASSVRDYLASRGVDPVRVSTEGRGSREPVADNATPQGRAQNRRVVIYVQEAQR